MDISEIKYLERTKFKNLRDKSTFKVKNNVKINVESFIDSYFKISINKYIGIYWPLKNEIDLRSLKEKYSLALPRCKKNRELLFCSWDKKILTKDCKGILAPEESNLLSYKQISMIFVPCLAVDKNYIRLGYGGGYFDFLRKDKNWRNIPCMGVLTSNCVSQDLLTRADWDIPLSGYITEKEILV